jgi:HNH endonuclease
VKASAKKTPQPTPAAPSQIQLASDASWSRVSTLRRDCLIRDRYRCVTSRIFDRTEALNRVNVDGDNAKDDDGNLLKDDGKRAEVLEVAHILPHSLMSYNAGGQTELVCYYYEYSLLSFHN